MFVGIPSGKIVQSLETIQLPEVGAVLTIREVVTGFAPEALLRFVEIVNPRIMTQQGMMERAYEVSCFRPLVTHSQEQDVARFRHLLTPSPIDAGIVPAGVEMVE